VQKGEENAEMGLTFNARIPETETTTIISFRVCFATILSFLRGRHLQDGDGIYMPLGGSERTMLHDFGLSKAVWVLGEAVRANHP
jgi:hypothetical protein